MITSQLQTNFDAQQGGMQKTCDDLVQKVLQNVGKSIDECLLKQQRVTADLQRRMRKVEKAASSPACGVDGFGLDPIDEA
eukprot:5774828-Karenia_brevis.AAC.1